MNEYSVAIIGGGNMGGAIAHALSRDSSFKVSVYERTREKGEALKKECNISLLSSIPDASGSDVVIIALKPQNLPHLYDTLRSLKPGLYISICAGVDLGTLTKNLESEKVVRFMPNIGAKVGASVTAVAFGKEVEEDKRDLSMKIARSFGEAFPLEENLFSAFIGISGSAIAFIYEFMHQISMAGVREGIPYRTSLDIVSGTMAGAAKLQKATGKGAIELETMVCSPRGTTIEGVKALTDGGFASIVQEAVEATVRKSEEMTQSAK